MSEFRFFAFTDYEFNNNRSLSFLQLPIAPFQPTKRTNADEISHELNVPYTVFEILVAICAVIGNLMVIVVFQRERKLRRRTNYYIVSLAIADFLVGSLGVPFAILASIGLPTNLHACLFTVSLLVVLCTISIFCLVAVSVDRYWAILYPMAYSRNVRTRTAIVIISMCWVAGSVVGLLPLFGWHAAVNDNQACLFVEVMDYNYLVFLYFSTIITPALLMLAFYAHIYKVIIKQVRQIVTMNPVGDCSRRSSSAQVHTNTLGRPCHGGTMLRVLGAARKRDVKATQNLSVIVLFFMICWIPLYTINCIKAFCPSCSIHPKLTLFCIILSHLNSAVNPVLYAYHLKDFRLALKNLILNIMGVEIDQTLEAQHRYSLASKQRLQSMDVSLRNPIQARIFVDSPIWLRQQQQQSIKNSQLVPKCSVVTPCLNNIHQTVAAVASVTTDVQKDMWQILEASGGAELDEVSYVFPYKIESAGPNPPPRHNRKSQSKTADCGSPFAYDNSTYTPSLQNNDTEEVFQPNRHQDRGVDHMILNQSLKSCAMRDKLKSGVYDQPPSSLSLSCYEIQKRDDYTSDIPNEILKIQNNAPLVTLKQQPKLKENVETAPPLNSKLCTSIFTISTASSGGKHKIRKSVHLTNSLKLNLKPRTRSCSCSSDTSASTSPQRDLKPSLHSTYTNSSSSLSVHLEISNQNLSPTFNEPHSQKKLNFNYYTFQHSSSHYHRTQYYQEKFSPLKAMTNLIFPPIVKHSSLFQLFHPTIAESPQQASTSDSVEISSRGPNNANEFSFTGTAAITNSTISVPALDITTDS